MCLGVPGEVIELREEHGLPMGKVKFGGITREVCLSCIPEVKVGEWVLVHVGFAIARLDREEAARAYETLAELGALAELGEES